MILYIFSIDGFKDLASRVMYRFFFLLGTDIGIHTFFYKVTRKVLPGTIDITLRASFQSTERSKLLSWLMSAWYKLNLSVSLLHLFYHYTIQHMQCLVLDITLVLLKRKQNPNQNTLAVSPDVVKKYELKKEVAMQGLCRNTVDN